MKNYLIKICWRLLLWLMGRNTRPEYFIAPKGAVEYIPCSERYRRAEAELDRKLKRG